MSDPAHQVLFFDYPGVAREAGIAEEELARLVEMIEAEWGGDQMMAELHLLRACLVVQEGHATIDQLLEERE